MTQIDISEEALIKESQELLSVLLKDRTTKKSIVWATHSYELLGRGFGIADSITPKKVTGAFAKLIQPRSEKSKAEQKDRTKVRAEVFTPTWLVKLQNQVVEDELSTLPLEDYVDIKWLEMTCGEAPYMVSRYDTVTGEEVGLADRVGFVDRKLQRISNEVSNEAEFFNLAVRAYKASYGYEYQGDSLLLARENLLATFEDYYQAAFAKRPTLEQKMEIATIISYNVMQMDGLAKVTPYSATPPKPLQLDLFGEVDETTALMEPKKTKLKDWTKNKMIGFERLSSEEIDMKFDVVIGNPPYQEETNNNRDTPIYHHFMDMAYEIANKAILITPARFLFKAGQTPSAWNTKMLEDEHLKVIYYSQNSAKIFPNTDIKGGIAVTYRDNTKNFGAIGQFISIPELNNILHKVLATENFISLNILHYGNSTYKLTLKVYQEHPDFIERVSQAERFSVGSNIFSRFPEIFYDNQQNDTDIQIYGREDNKRVYKWTKKKYIAEHPNLNKYKIFVPGANEVVL